MDTYRPLKDVSDVAAPVWAGFAVVVGSHIDGHQHLVFHECDPASGEPGEVARSFNFPRELAPLAGETFAINHAPKDEFWSEHGMGTALSDLAVF